MILPSRTRSGRQKSLWRSATLTVMTMVMFSTRRSIMLTLKGEDDVRLSPACVRRTWTPALRGAQLHVGADRVKPGEVVTASEVLTGSGCSTGADYHLGRLGDREEGGCEWR